MDLLEMKEKWEKYMVAVLQDDVKKYDEEFKMAVFRVAKAIDKSIALL